MFETRGLRQLLQRWVACDLLHFLISRSVVVVAADKLLLLACRVNTLRMRDAANQVFSQHETFAHPVTVVGRICRLVN